MAVEYTEMPIEVLREYLSYDPLTGVFIWIKRPSNRVKVGDVAGTPRKQGYLSISLHNNNMLAHRIAWAMHHGRWPTTRLDHRNLVRNDNRIDNLRETSNSHNMANMHMRPFNSAGYKGVTWLKKNRKFMGRIKINGRGVYLGSFDTAEEAHEAYRRAAVAQWGEFARFE